MNEQEHTATIDFLCGECHEYTRAFKAPLALGKNMCVITCSHCGERWHIRYEVLSLEPFAVAHDYEIKRALGVIRGGTFYAKEEMQ